MTDDTARPPVDMMEIGPMCWRNWRACAAGAPQVTGYEVPLFGDANVTGEIRCGPYHFLNPVPSEMTPGVVRPFVYVRVDEHHGADNDVLRLFKEQKTDNSSFVGGDANDEIAALVSLLLGMRCRTGGITRVFSHADDPRGRPVQYMMHSDPVLPKASRRWRVPRAYRQKPLGALQALDVIPTLDRKSCVEVLRAARLYQDALWLAEAEPDLCWIMLVSAIETAASLWRTDTLTPLERFRLWGTSARLEPLLQQGGGAELVEAVAKILAPITGSKRSFVDFLMEFCPDPPDPRPPAWLQVSWEVPARRQALGSIYDSRSGALHSGLRFPPPMSEQPFVAEGSGVPAETPIGFGTAQQGGYWEREHIPMLLHTFEDIARRALTNWLASLRKSPKT